MKTLYKTLLLIPLVFLFGRSESFSQLKVFPNNYVGINYTSTPSSRFVINHAGNSAYQAYIYNPSSSSSNGSLMTVSDKGTGGAYSKLALYSWANIGVGNYFYGIKAVANNATPTSTGRAYGIMAVAGNATNGYNYSVYGALSGTAHGAAIFGTINGLSDIGLSQQWAGYFRGDVKIENNVRCMDLAEISDEKFKTNITELDPAESIANLLNINPISYTLKQVTTTQTTGDTTYVVNYFDEKSLEFNRTRYGIVAQELKEIYPNLVFEEENGDLAIKYTGLIPIMIEVIQAQQKKINEFEEKFNVLTKELEGLIN
jgi:hypothetical protein